MVYLNPGGFDFGPENLDGYGISNIVFIVIYSLFFYTACYFTWRCRKHPVLRIRNVPLMLLSLLTMHVFTFAVMIVYTMNGAFPCHVEYWSMCLYLPIGIGLYQAYNQQLLIVSRGQAALITKDELFKPLFPKGKGIGGPNYWAFRLRIWWQNVSSKGKYEGFVLIGIVIQFTVSFVIFNISRKFSHYGIVGHHTSPAMCRRGWEWVPSIIWQFLWNYVFGPYLLWNIRMIRDIYHWRLQTTLAIIAGLPGAPVWLAAIYSDAFGPINRYWVPAMWLMPGLLTIEIVTLGFPIYAIYKNKQAAREVNDALADFDQKRLHSLDESTTLGGSHRSLTTKGSTTASKKGKMSPMESLDACLNGCHDGLQVYASCMELNGENIIFLTKVIAFSRQCQRHFADTCTSTGTFREARRQMFRMALSIFISLVHAETANYPINIESTIYTQLDGIFGAATQVVARRRSTRAPSVVTTGSSKATPWDDEPPDDPTAPEPPTSYSLRSLFPISNSDSNKSSGNESSEHIVRVREDEICSGGGGDDPLEGIDVPAAFDERVFDAAFKSVRFMVWTETWQRFVRWRGDGGGT